MKTKRKRFPSEKYCQKTIPDQERNLRSKSAIVLRAKKAVH